MQTNPSSYYAPADLVSRRRFIGSAALLTGAALLPSDVFGAADANLCPRKKKPALVRGAFFYPPATVVDAGEAEDMWAPHQWHTYPGNQFKPEEQQQKFLSRVGFIAKDLDLQIRLDEKPIYTETGVKEFLARMESDEPEALLLFNFWNSCSKKVRLIIEAWKGPIILYHPVGASHQLPPDYFLNAPRVQYIHSIENWDALERGLRSLHAMNRMRQSRLLRVSGTVSEPNDAEEPWFKLPIHTVPAAEFNQIFDETSITAEMKSFARNFRRGARKVTDLTDESFLDAARAHSAVRKILDRHDADAITIECLFLKHRKPCLSFSLNNGNLVPCGCENHLEATLTLMLGSNAFGRGGFQHNPEFDTEQNLYFGAHCTCATRLHGPGTKSLKYDLRPFFHQLPKTPALDVKWPEGETVTVCKYQAGKPVIDAWRGKVVTSPASPPTGGCATRVLLSIDNIPNVCSVYSGPHPVLYCGDFARHLQTFAKLYGAEIRTNV